jgi:hypothetical protein
MHWHDRVCVKNDLAYALFSAGRNITTLTT